MKPGCVDSPAAPCCVRALQARTKMRKTRLCDVMLHVEDTNFICAARAQARAVLRPNGASLCAAAAHMPLL
jgi:hypothetical protein